MRREFDRHEGGLFTTLVPLRAEKPYAGTVVRLCVGWSKWRNRLSQEKAWPVFSMPGMVDRVVNVLKERVGQTIMLEYRHWTGGGFAVSTGNFEVLHVDEVWPAVLLAPEQGAATRVPLEDIVALRQEGEQLWP